jgi:hypothetical protein
MTMRAWRTVAVVIGVFGAACATHRSSQRAQTPVAPDQAGVQAQQQPGAIVEHPGNYDTPNTERQPVSGRDQLENGTPLIEGLAAIEVTEVMTDVKPENVVDASTVLSDAQLKSLLQALDGNQKASQTASDLTQKLLLKGILSPSERIIGASNGKLYKTSR